MHRSKRRVRRYRYRSRPQRNPLVLATAGAFSVAVAAMISFASFSGIDVAGAAVAKGKSLIELMNQRSPGKRVAAQLIKTKGKHKYYRVLAERPAPEMPAPDLYQPLVDVWAPLPTLYAGWPQLPDVFVTPPPGVPPGIFFPCCGVFVPPGPPIPPPHPPAGPVPEPGTWMTMILGFGVAGWQLRRLRRSGTRTSRV